MPPSWLPSIPANARSSAVVLIRPCTFLFSLLLGLAALVASAFFSLTHLSPPQCRCCAATDDEPRTRPRPASPTEPRPPALREPQPQTRSTFEHFLTAFRPSSRPPLAVRRVSARVLGGGFAPHELDELKEAEEEEEDDEEEEEDVVREKSRSTSPGAVAPALTPDAGSEVDTDGGSEVSTVEDDRAHLGQPAVSKAGKPKGLAIFTGLRLRRTPSASKKASSTSPVIASPEELSGSSSPTSSIHSASSSSLSSACKKACPVKALRTRASTTAGASRPTLPSTLAPIPRRQFSEPGLSSPETDYFSQALLSPSSTSFASTTATTASSLLSDASASTSATSLSSEPTPPAPQLNRKRSVSSLFLRTPFRSLSPLARSPLTSPEPSPPPSPTLAPPQLSQSLSAKSKSKRTRGRSPGPSSAVELARAPQLRKRVSSGPGADCTGASRLALSDVAAQTSS